MHEFGLILTLAGSLTAALLLGYATHRLGLSPIVGYLLAGVIVGPNTRGFTVNTAIAEQFAEVGVILLMFGVGLQFHLAELIAVRRVAIPGALLASSAAATVGFLVAQSVGWSAHAGLIYGIALSVASTVVLVRVLTDNRALHTRTGHIAIGWLVVEDVTTIVALVMLPAFIGSPASVSGVVGTLLISLLKVGGLIVFTMVVGTRVIPVLLDRVAATRSRELFTLTVLVLALGISVGAALLFQVSVALGAFLAGTVVGRSDFSHRAASEALPMRDAFAVLFFVSVGMLLVPATILDAPGLLAATLAVILVGKPLVAFLIVRLLGYPFNVGLSVAVALGQIGEFSFILSSLGKQLGVLSETATNTLVAASLVSIVLNPMLYRAVPGIERRASRYPWLWRWLNPPATVERPADAPAHVEPRYRAVVVGYGPTGRTVTRLLGESGIEPTVIDLSMDSIRELRASGIGAIYGDATHRETLQAAGITGAGALILTSAGETDTSEVIRTARDLNPSAYILARTAYLREMPALRRAGADDVFTGEGEVALAFTAALLNRLGATPEQLDRERDRAHTALFGKANVQQAGGPEGPPLRGTGKAEGDRTGQ